MTDLTTSPVRCAEPGCHWAAHGIPTKYTEARARHLADHAAEEHAPAAGLPEPTVSATRYVVSCFPPDDRKRAVFNLAVEYRGSGLWAVTRFRQSLGVDGEWSPESVPSEREDEWLAVHRFPLDEALKLAKKAAPHVVVNGRTAAEAYQRTHPTP